MQTAKVTTVRELRELCEQIRAGEIDKADPLAFIDLQTAASLLGISRFTLSRWQKQEGKMPFVLHTRGTGRRKFASALAVENALPKL